MAPALLCASLLAGALAQAEQFSVLVFTKTAGWHHDAVHAGVGAVEELGKLHPATDRGKGMGAIHPVGWYQPYEGGRAFYTMLGHLPATYRDPGFLHHLYGGIYWAATGRGFRAE